MATTKIGIGRDPNCDIALNHPTVSAQHAELSLIGEGKWLLTDCRSRNGTYMVAADSRRTRIRQHLVSPMDWVDFGEARLQVRDILEAWRLKTAAPPVAEMGGAPSPRSEEPAPGELLERCHCGAIKPVGGRCPACDP